MTKVIQEIVAGILLAFFFVIVTISLIKSPHPYFYLSFYLAIQLAAFLFFSIFGAIIVAILATVVALGTLIIAETWFAASAICTYWSSIFILNLYITDISKEYGRQKLDIENREKNIGFVSVKEKGLTTQIPNLNERITRYIKMADFSMQLSTSFDDEILYMFIIDYVKDFFPNHNIQFLTHAEDQYDRWVFDRKAPLLVENTQKDYRFKSIVDYDAVSMMECPIFLDGEVSGLVKVKSPELPFSASDLRLLNISSMLSSIALERARLFKQTEELAITDDLTGLFTQTYFKERLDEEVKRAARYNEDFSVIMMDIDNYKHFNDTFGHQAGDIVLKNVADTILYNVRDTDLVARYGGEELSVILHGISKKEAKKIAEKIRGAIKNMEFVFDYRKVNVTMTLGVSFFPESPTPEVLIRRADEALYHGKRKGKDCVILAGDDV